MINQLKEKYLGMEFNDQTGKNKVVDIVKIERTIYIEFLCYKFDTVYGMKLKDFERVLQLWEQ